MSIILIYVYKLISRYSVINKYITNIVQKKNQTHVESLVSRVWKSQQLAETLANCKIIDLHCYLWRSTVMVNTRESVHGDVCMRILAKKIFQSQKCIQKKFTRSWAETLANCKIIDLHCYLWRSTVMVNTRESVHGDVCMRILAKKIFQSQKCIQKKFTRSWNTHTLTNYCTTAQKSQNTSYCSRNDL